MPDHDVRPAATPEPARRIEERGELRAILDQLPEGVIVLNARTGRVELINQAALRMATRDESQQLDPWGNPILFDVFCPDGRPCTVEEMPVVRAFQRGEVVRGVELQIRQRDGRLLPVLASAAPLLGPEGQIEAGIGLFHDITALKEPVRGREKLVHDLGERVKELSTVYGVARLTGERRPWPEAFVEVTRLVESGWQFPEITRSHIVLDGHEYAARRFAPTPWCQAADISVAGKVRGAIEVYYLEGRPPAAEGPFLAEERALINEVARSLGEMVERQELEQLQEDYVSLVSHDLRAPLTVIIGQSGLMQRRLAEVPDERLRQGTNGILAAAQRMSGIIENLVDSVRLRTGRLEVQRAPESLPALVQELVQTGLPEARRRRVRLSVEEELPPVSLDRRWIERALTNLLDNALKYSPQDSPVLVGLQRADDEALISVRDWGPGIAPEDLPRLFERFYRAPRGRAAEGLGLGLYITRLIAEAHDGRVWAESEKGAGSTFYLALPLD